jgi:acyl-CoA synthetase (NDP forming)
VVAVPGSSARTEPHRAVKPVIDCAGSGKPLAAFVVPDAPDALALLSAAGIANFRTPEACADAVAAAFARRAPKPLAAHSVSDGPSRLLDELAAYELLAGLGLRHARVEAIAAARATTRLPFPVAVKVLCADIPHKTDAGGVVLDVKDECELAAAIARIRASVASSHPDAKADRMLVQSMVKGVGEALVGYQCHPQVGPMVMVASGGLLAEIHRDRSLRMAPVDIEEARRMVREVKAFAALAGYRGGVRGDLEALAAAIVALSNLAADVSAPVLEAEINPLMVMPEGEGVLAVDALVRVRA